MAKACQFRVGPKGYAMKLLAKRGQRSQYGCLDDLWGGHESGWNHRVNNGGYVGPPQKGRSYGIPQALPAAKMAKAGADWATNPRTQVRWGIVHYIGPRYGGPCAALAFRLANGWY